MYTESDDELGDLERRMLALVKKQLRDFEDEDDERPLPSALVQLLLGTHKAVLQRMSKRRGIDLEAIKKNPRAALVMLEKEKALILKVIEQTENQGLKIVEGGR